MHRHPTPFFTVWMPAWVILMALPMACSPRSYPCPEPGGGHEKQTMPLNGSGGAITTYKAPKKKNGLLKKSTPSRLKKD